MELRVVQTSPKLILEWDPVPGAVAGYRGRAEGTEKWTQTQSTRMTFAANATGIVIQALGVVDEGNYPSPLPQPDPPSLASSSIKAGDTIKGNVTWSVEAADTAAVEFWANDAKLGEDATPPNPFVYILNTTALPEGDNHLGLALRGFDGSRVTPQIGNVTVDNIVPTPPTGQPLWNGDWETGNKSQYGGTEFGGTFDGTPALSDQLKIIQSDGAVTPLQGKWFAKTIIVPGAQYGGSSGWRCLTRQYDPIRLRGEGYDSWGVFGVRFPPSFSDEWVFMQWHQNGGQWPKPLDMDPGVTEINARVVIDKPGAPGELDQKSYPIPMVKDVWHVFVVRMKFSTTSNGKMQMWHGIKGRDTAVTRKVDHSGRTLMNPPADKAHLMFGLYGPQSGTSNRWVYHDAAREYATEADALAYANSLL